MQNEKRVDELVSKNCQLYTPIEKTSFLSERMIERHGRGGKGKLSPSPVERTYFLYRRHQELAHGAQVKNSLQDAEEKDKIFLDRLGSTKRIYSSCPGFHVLFLFFLATGEGILSAQDAACR